MLNNLIFYGILSFVVMGALAGLYYKIDKGGYDRRDAEYKAAQKEADDAAKQKQLIIRKKSQENEDEIRNDSEEYGDRPVGPVILRQLDRLRAA